MAHSKGEHADLFFTAKKGEIEMLKNRFAFLEKNPYEVLQMTREEIIKNYEESKRNEEAAPAPFVIQINSEVKK